MLRTALIALAVAALMPALAYAQPDAGDWDLTFGGSGNSGNEFSQSTFNLTGSAGYHFTENWELGLRQNIGYSDLGGSQWVGSSFAFLDYHFTDGTNELVPFVGVNGGYIYGDGVDDTFGAGFEGGLKWYLREKTYIFGMAQYSWLFEDADDADDSIEDGIFTYTFGIGMNF